MIPFHETRRGQWFFEAQLPKLITALSDIADSLKAPRPTYQLKAEVPENFLSDLYLGNYVPFDLPATDLKKELTPEIIAIQEQLRKSVSEDAWALIEQYGGLLAISRTSGQEQAFAAGFRSAMTMLAAGLAQPMTAERSDRRWLIPGQISRSTRSSSWTSIPSRFRTFTGGTALSGPIPPVPGGTKSISPAPASPHP